MRIWTFYFSSSNHACFDHLSRETTQSTALEQERFDIWSLSRALGNLWLIGTLRSNDADGNENVKKKNNRFNKQNNNFARASHFFVHFFPVFARLRRENA